MMLGTTGAQALLCYSESSSLVKYIESRRSAGAILKRLSPQSRSGCNY
jgi:hypothetical protein